MPLLSPTDPLPALPTRVVVAGTSGSGKTTLAARIAEILEVQHIEIDGLYHGPDWTPRPSFTADVAAFSAEPAWTTEWQYSPVRLLLLERADLLVWLDLPTRTAMRQVIGRTLRRRLRREELWNGNVEPPLHTFFSDPEHIVRWAWSTRHKARQRISAARQTRPELPIVHLRSHRESEQWLRHVLTPMNRNRA
ncbi:MAG: AAA family ATPase [Actinomycetia bacterium]|nr:AAA family ATPase [Actinomycetes bacterium]